MAIGGGAEIDSLFSNANGGVFRMDAGVAQRCAGAVETLIRDLTVQREGARRTAVALRWTLESERQMYEGFLGKLDRLGTILDEYLLAAQKLRLSFLTAGQVLTEQDVEISASIVRAEQAGQS